MAKAKAGDKPGEPRVRLKDLETREPLIEEAINPARAASMAKKREERGDEDKRRAALRARRPGMRAPRVLSGKTQKAIVLYGAYRHGTKRYHAGATVDAAPVEDVEQLACLQAVK